MEGEGDKLRSTQTEIQTGESIVQVFEKHVKPEEVFMIEEVEEIFLSVNSDRFVKE